MPNPVLAGVTLPLPSSHTRTPEAVEQTSQLASGAVARYHLGYRMVVALSWDVLGDLDAARVTTLGMQRDPVPFTDIDGATTVVLVSDPQVQAIPGTDPVRYTASLTLSEQAPRIVAPLPVPVAPTPTPGPGDGGAVQDPNDPDAVIISGTQDPNDPDAVIV